MNLTIEEKRKIFWALLKEYPDHERGRIQAKQFFSGERLNEVIKNVNEVERKAYDLIKKFAEEIGEEIPNYTEPMPSGNKLEKEFKSKKN